MMDENIPSNAEAATWLVIERRPSLDDPAAPKAIVLCPATCTTVQAGVSAKVDLGFGCDPKLAPVE